MALSGGASGRHGRGDTRGGRSGFGGRDRDRERSGGNKSPAKGAFGGPRGTPGAGGYGGARVGPAGKTSGGSGGLAPGGGLASALTQPARYTGAAAGRQGIQPGAGLPGGGTMGTTGAQIKAEVERQFGKQGLNPNARDLTMGGVGGFLTGGIPGAAIGLAGALLDSYNPGFASPGGTVGGLTVGSDSTLGGGGLRLPGNDGRGGRDDVATPRMLPSGRAPNQPAAAAVTPKGFARPSAMSMPASLARFLNSAMTPLQSRSAIATYGTQGDGPNDREAFDYWRNLFTRDFVDDSGQFRPLDDPYNMYLPVEQQWLQQAFGFSPPTGGDTRSLLEALATY